MDSLAGGPLEFNFSDYLRSHPYDPSSRPRRLIRVAFLSKWAVSSEEWMSSVTQPKFDALRVEWRVPMDVHLHALDPTERANQPPDGMVGLNFDIMGVGLRFPLHPNISHLLNFLDIAPL